METIAVYWEERIKVYSITVKKGLCLATLDFPYHAFENISSCVRNLEQQINRFELVTYQGGEEQGEFFLLLEESHIESLESHLQTEQILHPPTQLRFSAPVDLLYLHGPHFQDRYGILDTAVRAFTTNNITIICSGCAGTSMYLILPAGIGDVGHKILTDTFIIPKNC